jgi:hypothetical protein
VIIGFGMDRVRADGVEPALNGRRLVPHMAHADIGGCFAATSRRSRDVRLATAKCQMPSFLLSYSGKPASLNPFAYFCQTLSCMVGLGLPWLRPVATLHDIRISLSENQHGLKVILQFRDDEAA